MDIGIGLPELREGIIYLIILMCSLSLHECGHAYMAHVLGDDTPYRDGRLTLNPLVHIDIIGTILVPAMGVFGLLGNFTAIGWAKPIYTDPRNFKRGQFDQALVTIAGPGVNFALALIATILAALMQRLIPSLTELFSMIITVNVGLFVFNLLPIPPLDGSKFLMYWFGMSEETYVRLSTWGSFLLLFLLNVPVFRGLFSAIFQIAMVPFDRLYQILT